MLGASLEKPPQRTICFLDGFKFFLIAIVIIGHFYNFIGGRANWGIRLLGGMGAKAVDGFLFLSGFLTMYSYLYRKKERRKNSVLAFYIRKLRRLYPVYFVSIVLAALLQPVTSAVQRQVLIALTGGTMGAFQSHALAMGFPSFPDLLVHLTLTQGIFTQYSSTILGPAWYMGTEWLCLLVSPAIGWIIFHNDKIGLAIKALLILWAGMAAGLAISAHADMEQSFLRNFPIFYMGSVVALGYMQLVGKRVVLTGILSGFVYLMLLDRSQNWLSCLFILIASLLLFNHEKCGLLNAVDRIFSCTALKKIAKSVYSMYLLHMLAIPISFLVAGRILRSPTEMVVMAACLSVPLIAGMSALSYRFVELKFMKAHHRSSENDK